MCVWFANMKCCVYLFSISVLGHRFEDPNAPVLMVDGQPQSLHQPLTCAAIEKGRLDKLLEHFDEASNHGYLYLILKKYLYD